MPYPVAQGAAANSSAIRAGSVAASCTPWPNRPHCPRHIPRPVSPRWGERTAGSLVRDSGMTGKPRRAAASAHSSARSWSECVTGCPLAALRHGSHIVLSFDPLLNAASSGRTGAGPPARQLTPTHASITRRPHGDASGPTRRRCVTSVPSRSGARRIVRPTPGTTGHDGRGPERRPPAGFSRLRPAPPERHRPGPGTVHGAAATPTIRVPGVTAERASYGAALPAAPPCPAPPRGALSDPRSVLASLRAERNFLRSRRARRFAARPRSLATYTAPTPRPPT